MCVSHHRGHHGDGGGADEVLLDVLDISSPSTAETESKDLLRHGLMEVLALVVVARMGMQAAAMCSLFSYSSFWLHPLFLEASSSALMHP
jgi:hypothetical protein